MGTKIYGGESSHLPLKINTAGVIPAIFASALLLLPMTFSNFGFSDTDAFIDISSLFSQGKPLYMILYASGIIFFSFFYTSIVFNPKETAENLRKHRICSWYTTWRTNSLFYREYINKINNYRSIISNFSVFNARIFNCKISYSILLRRNFNINCRCCCYGYSYTSTN